MADEYGPIMSSEQVAEMLGMNVQMIRLAAREGRIPAYRLPGGRAFKFFRDETFEWLHEHPAIGSNDSAEQPPFDRSGVIHADPGQLQMLLTDDPTPPS